MDGKKGPLSNLVQPEDVLNDVQGLGDNPPREVIEQVLQEVGSLQYAMVMERLAGVEDKLDLIFDRMEETNKILKKILKD